MSRFFCLDPKPWCHRKTLDGNKNNGHDIQVLMQYFHFTTITTTTVYTGAWQYTTS